MSFSQFCISEMFEAKCLYVFQTRKSIYNIFSIQESQLEITSINSCSTHHSNFVVNDGIFQYCHSIDGWLAGIYEPSLLLN